MPAPEARDETITAAILTELAKIGNAPSSDWLTAPPDATEGSPGDALDDGLDLQLYFDHHGTSDLTGEDAMPVNSHQRLMQATIWCFAKVTTDNTSRGRKKVRQLAADCVRALQAAEDTLQALTASVGVRCGDFQMHHDMAPAGFACGGLKLTVQYEQLHGAP